MLDQLGYLREIAGDLAGSERALRQALDLAQSIGDDGLAVRTWIALVWTVSRDGRPDEALELARFAESAIERAGDAGAGQLPHLHNIIGTIALSQGDLPTARARFDQARQAWSLDPDDAFHFANATNNLALVLQKQGEPELALGALLEALSIAERELDPRHQDLGRLARQAGRAAAEAGRHTQALQLLDKARARLQASLGADHPDLAELEVFIGESLDALGRHDEARQRLEQAHAALQVEAEAYPERARAAWSLARALPKTEATRALSLAREALADYARAGSSWDGRRAEIRAWLDEREG